MAEPFILAENLSYTYKDEDGAVTAALHGVSFSVQSGEYVAVLGHNGSGKSTLAKLLNVILTPSSGSLTVAGHRIHSEMSEDEVFEVRREVGMVFQNPDN
ncbi:MAG: ATP-binding cassette domain-containing protein, partial [Clostridia bacterium]|nr:ATP-binding cassette domain-containing protein [Clostridia bacterium]